MNEVIKKMFWDLFWRKGDNNWCLWLGHKLKALKDEKTVWCDRCNRRIALFKKGYAFIGIDAVRKKQTKLLWDIPYTIFLMCALVYVIYLFITMF